MKRVDTSIRTFEQATGLAGFARESEVVIWLNDTLAEFSIDKGKHSP
jgi:hypothetical protein